jgi:hypothetical protein
MISRSYLIVLVSLLFHIGIAAVQESYPIAEPSAETPPHSSGRHGGPSMPQWPLEIQAVRPPLSGQSHQLSHVPLVYHSWF